MQPWAHQSSLKKEKIPGINDILLIAAEIQEPRTQALFILAYLTAGRIGELVRYNRKGAQHPSIKKKDLTVTEKRGRQILLISLRNEKNKKRANKEIPIPLDKPENIRFWNMLIEYINTIGIGEELFPFGYQNSKRLLDKTGFNPHFIRHIRLTHLVTVYDFNEQELRMYAGWVDGRPAKHYIELRWGDFLRKL